MKLLHHALPPTLGDLNFNIVAASMHADDLAPEGLSGCIGRHLANFPWPGMALQRMQGQCAACANTALPLEYEKLLHPLALLSRHDRWSYECEANVLRTINCDMRVKPFVLSMTLQAVTVLGFGICLLWPDVGQLVLIELQHLLQRREVFWRSFAEFERHGRCLLRPNVRGKRATTLGRRASATENVLGHSAYARRRKHSGRLRRKLGADLSTPIWLSILAELGHGLSPEQYTGRIRLLDGLLMPTHLHSALFVSHQTIYRAIHDLPHSPARAELTRLLRRSTGGRRPRRASSRYTGLQNMTPLDQRPKEADSRLTLGHWEGDLIKGAANGSAVGTLVERASRMVVLVPLRSANATEVYEGFKRALSQFPACARLSFTYDRGSEMARHQDLSKALSMPIFFCPPYRPGDRACNENTNGLLRQYLPKGTVTVPPRCVPLAE